MWGGDACVALRRYGSSMPRQHLGVEQGGDACVVLVGTLPCVGIRASPQKLDRYWLKLYTI